MKKTNVQRERIRRLFAAVHEVLVNDWDPIGGVPDDEYDSYIPALVRLLEEGSDQGKIADCLFHLETVSMGLCGDRQRCVNVADKLLSLMTGSR